MVSMLSTELRGHYVRARGAFQSMCRLGVPLAILGLALGGCDPVPNSELRPPGGYSAVPNTMGEAAIRAVLYTPSHGSFRTVREALTTYIGRTTEAVEIGGWSAHAATAPLDRYLVEFSWRDSQEEHYAEWELNEYGVWPLNDEARYLSMYPPEDGRR